MNVYDYLLNHNKAENIAILSRDSAVTYAALSSMAEGIAFALRCFAIQKGERIAILAENSAFWVAAYLAILKIAAVAVPIPARLSAQDFAKFVAMMDIRAFCIDPIRLSNPKLLPAPKSKLILPSEDYPADLTERFQILVPIPKTSSPSLEISEQQDLAALMFTSGSDGKPNAVRISHRNIMANTDSILEYLELSSADKMLVALPFDYCFGTSLLHSHLRVAGTLVINNTVSFIETVVEDMASFECTGFAGVPSLYQQLLRGSSLSRHNLSKLRYVQQAGGKLADIFIQQFSESLPKTRFFVMYGQTEATARLSYLPPEKLSEKMGSIGRGIAGVKLEVLDTAGNAVKLGEVGEIVATGDNIASGYWLDDPEKKPFRDGKLYTGDMARVDADGYIYLVGRSSDFLKLSGYRVSSSEIEAVLYQIPDILEAAVVAAQAGSIEIAKAYIVLRQGAALSPEEIIQHCKKNLPAYAVPRQIEFLAELPKNEAGKILKRELRLPTQ